MSKTVILSGTIIDPQSGWDGPGDLVIEGSVIVGIEKPGSVKPAERDTVIDAAGKWVVPGLIDLHVHLREPGFEWKETIATGSHAAVLGGFTSVCCMPNTKPTNDSAEVTKFIIERGRAVGAARILPIGAVSIGLKGKEMAPVSEMVRAGCVAFSDDGEPIFDAGLMRRALEWALIHGVVISCHEEDKSLSCGGCMNESALSTRLGLKGMAKVAEDVMVARDIELARATGGRVHMCHVSTARSVELVRRAKRDGFHVTAEVTPHHLVLTEDAIGEYDTYAKMSPPLREQEDVDALLEGLRDGTLDAVASDHAPHEEDTKKVEFSKASFGILGLQTSLPVLLDLVRAGTLSRIRAVEVLTSGPARCFGLPTGRLAAGAPADVTIVDPDHVWVFDSESVRSLSRNSPFLDREMKGIADTVLVDGKVVVRGRELQV